MRMMLLLMVVGENIKSEADVCGVGSVGISGGCGGWWWVEVSGGEEVVVHR